MTETELVAKPAVLEQISYDQSGVIEASAGTGKTYTIEHMVVDLLLERNVRIPNILVVTFTERATGELVRRVRTILKQIHEGEAEAPEDPSEPHWVIDQDARERLQRALLAFDRAPVHTIHSFCNRVLNEHAFPNKRPFEQEQIDGERLFDRVFPSVLRDVLARDSDYSPVLRAYLADNSLESLRDTIRESTGTWEEIRPQLEDINFEELQTALERFVAQFDEAGDQIQQAVDDGRVHGRDEGKVERILGGFRAAAEAYRSDPSIWTFKGALDRKIKSGDDPFEYFVESKGNKDWMPDSVPETLAPFLGVDLDPETVVINKFADEVEDRVEQEKDEAGLYTYDDMLAMVEEGVTGDSSAELIQTLRGEFDYAIIDEFQDTDPRQWEIFKQIFFESDGSNPCYLIGDPKQAIYGFRGADVKTYQDAAQAVRSANDGENDLTLDTNYRSTSDLVRAYNLVLGEGTEGSFFHEDGTNRYRKPVEAGFEDKWFGRSAEEPAKPIVIPDLVSDPDKPIKPRRYERLLAEYYAEEIQHLLSTDEHRISNDEGEEPEPLTGEDIFVLVNKNQEARLVARYLSAKDIPHSFYKEEGLFTSDEARHLFRVLQACLDPNDRSRRLMAWHTPFFDVGLDELQQVDRATDEDHPLFQRLARWNDLAEREQVGRLVHRVLHDSGVLRRAVYRYPGERSLTNYQQLGDRLIQWWQQDSLSAEEVTARLGRLVREEQQTGEAEEDTKHRETDESTVQIMTMHKAKGLQAPVVFLFGGWGTGTGGPYTFYPEDSDRRVKYFGSKSPHSEKIDQYEREENERILYVAMTRASGRLYLPHVGPQQWADHYRSKPHGRIRPLFDRLREMMESEQGINGDYFKVVEPDVDDRYPPLPEPERPEGQDWSLPEDLEVGPDLPFGDYRAERKLYVESYTSVTHRLGSTDGSDQSVMWGERQPFFDQSEPEERTLPAGPQFGQYVHELYEELSFSRLEEYRENGGFEEWAALDSVRDRLNRCRGTYGFDPEHDEPTLRLVWDSLTGSVSLPEATVSALSSVPRHDKEREFWVPMPESDHPVVGEAPVEGSQLELYGQTEVPFRASRGYLRGFVDLIFEWDGRIYAADWKTDSLDGEQPYEPDSLKQIVDQKYKIQLYFYTHALMRLVERSGDSLEDRFGGLLYFFVRGMSQEDRASGTGVYGYRPSPDEFGSVSQRTEDLVSQHLNRVQEGIRRE